MAATPRLSIVTIDPNRHPEVNFELGHELSTEELTEYKKAKGVLSRFMEDQQKIKLLRETYDEYKSVVEAEARRLEVRERPMPVSEVHMQDLRAYHQVNGRVRGLLSEITTFLNYAEGYLKREYGHDSEQVEFYKARTHKE